jgi:hypothetical protein
MIKDEIKEKIALLNTELLDAKGTPCEVYSRVVGYFRPVKQWNDGKMAEFHDRVTFKLDGIHENIKCSK